MNRYQIKLKRCMGVLAGMLLSASLGLTLAPDAAFAQFPNLKVPSAPKIPSVGGVAKSLNSPETACNAAIRSLAGATTPESCEKIEQDNLDTCLKASSAKREELLAAAKERMKQIISPMCEACLYQRNCDALIANRTYAFRYMVHIKDQNGGGSVSCESLATDMETEVPKQIADENAIKGYDAVLRSTQNNYREPVFPPEILDAEMAKNQTFWNNLNDNSSAIEVRRAQTYIMYRIAKDLETTGVLPLDFYLDIGTVRRMNILRKLLTSKYDCENSFHYSGDISKYSENQVDSAKKGDSAKKTEEKPLPSPYCESDEFKKALADYKYIINIKPGSKRYKNGFKLNPTGDQAYILGSNAIVTVPKSYDYLLPYDQLPVYPDLNKIYGSIKESCVFSDLYKFWLGRMLQPFAFDYKLIQKLHDKDNIESEELVNEELKEMKEMYPKAAALCKNNASCKAYALKETLRRRDYIYLNSKIIYHPEFVPQNDDVIMTEQFKKWFNELPAEEMKGFRVPDAAMIRDTKAKTIAKMWEDSKDAAPKSEMSDAAAEKAVKAKIESLDPKLKVKKVIFDGKWRMEFESNGVPSYEYAYAAVCVADPDRKGVVLCTYDYSVRVEKEYAGGAKLKEVGATTTFRGDTAHTSLDYEYQGGAKFSAPEVASIGGSPLMYTKTNTPDNYYIATNIK